MPDKNLVKGWVVYPMAAGFGSQLDPDLSRSESFAGFGKRVPEIFFILEGEL